MMPFSPPGSRRIALFALALLVTALLVGLMVSSPNRTNLVRPLPPAREHLLPTPSSTPSLLPTPPEAAPLLQAAQHFADAVLVHGRDQYGPMSSPLFVDGLAVTDGRWEPATWRGPGGKPWVLSNMANQQPLMRLLFLLSELTGDRRYETEATAAVRYFLDHAQVSNGLVYWGGHVALDLISDKPIGVMEKFHELKGTQPFFELFWKADPVRTQHLLEALWSQHVLDWQILDYNRHGSFQTKKKARWKSRYREDVVPPFPATESNLSFVSYSQTLARAGVALTSLSSNPYGLIWTERLLSRWQQARHPLTGLSGGLLGFRKDDRAREALGHRYPTINEASMVAANQRYTRYHALPLTMLQLGEDLLLQPQTPSTTRQGNQFIAWASSDLISYAAQCYDRASRGYQARLTSGELLDGSTARTGYYDANSFSAQPVDGNIFWAHALAYRLTRNQSHWLHLQDLFEALSLGVLADRPDGSTTTNVQTDRADASVLYGIMELYRVTHQPHMLALATRVGENIRSLQSSDGLFPRPGRTFARTGDEFPLALLHLAMLLMNRSSPVVRPVADEQYFHAIYHGPLAPYQRKRADDRTYDNLVFFEALPSS